MKTKGPHFSTPHASSLIYRAQAGYYFYHRTDPKPRPEGYRDYSEEGSIGLETVKMVGRGMFMAEDDGAETYWQDGSTPEL